MIHALLGRKIAMSQVFSETGDVIPVTVLQAGPCPVVQVKSDDTDGYRAYQIGFEPKRKNVTKPLKGHFRKAGVPAHRHLREVRYEGDAPFEAGSELRADVFAPGDKIDIVGTSKGKGFQGTIKRHGFSRQRQTHGCMSTRRPGSIGCATYPGRVGKGKRMHGHTGMDTITVRNVEVVRVDLDADLLYVKGSVPGAPGGLLLIRDAKTKTKPEQRDRAYTARKIALEPEGKGKGKKDSK